MNKPSSVTDIAKQFFVELGPRICAIRKSQGMSQYDVCLKAGYQDSQWRRYERGGTTMTVETLLRIADTFGISLSKLVEGIGEREPKASERRTSNVSAAIKGMQAKVATAAKKTKPKKLATTKSTSKPSTVQMKHS